METQWLVTCCSVRIGVARVFVCVCSYACVCMRVFVCLCLLSCVCKVYTRTRVRVCSCECVLRQAICYLLLISFVVWMVCN